MTALNGIQRAALEYLERDWSVLPLGKDKKPLGRWRQWMEAPMTATEAETLFRHAPGVGIICGPVSGLMVLDFDGRIGESADHELSGHLNLPGFPRVKTGSGLHRYFRYEAGQRVVPWYWDWQRAGELRGEGGYVVAPPSPHPSGRHYKWIERPGSDLPLIPESARLHIDLGRAHVSQPAQAIFTGHPTAIEAQLLAIAVERSRGERNNAGFKLACQLRDNGIDENDARRVLIEYAQRVRDLGRHPYHNIEAIMSVRQAYSRPGRQRGAYRSPRDDWRAALRAGVR
jgi:hypothetical protein